MLHRGHRTWTPYVDPHPDKENTLQGLPLKTPVRHAAGSSKHHTLNGKASMMGKQAPMTGGKAGLSQTVKGKEKEGGVEGGKRAPMTVFKDRNLVLTGKKNGVSERGSRDGGENDTFGIKKLDFKSAGTSTAAAKPKSKLNQQVSIPSPADDGFSALPHQTPFTTKQATRTSLGGVDSTPLPSATRSRRRSRHSGTPLGGPSPESAQLGHLTATPAHAFTKFPSSTSLSTLLAPTPFDKSFITPARPSYRAYLSPPEYEMEGEDEDMDGRDESFEMGEMRMRMGGLGVVDENDGEMMVDAEVELAQMETTVESDGEIEYMPPKVVALPDVIPFDFVPLKTLGQQLRQITSDYFIADSDSDEEAYTHVERRWNLDLGKQELLVGGWEGDEEVKPTGTRGLKRLELRPDSEFHNPIFAALKINQPRVASNKRPVASGSTQATRRPMVPTARKPLPAQQSKSSSGLAGQQRPSTFARRPITLATSRLTQAPPRPTTTTAPTRRERLPVSSATSRATHTIRPASAVGIKQTTQRSTTVRPALGQVRANIKPQPVKEVLLKCEDIGFDL